MDKKILVPSSLIIIISFAIATIVGIAGYYAYDIIKALQVFGFTVVLIYASAIDLKYKLVSDWVHLFIFLFALITLVPDIIQNNTLRWVYSIAGFMLLPLPFLIAAIAGKPNRCPDCKSKLSESDAYCGDCGRITENGLCISCGKGKKREYYCKKCGIEIISPVGGGDIKLTAVCGLLLGFRLGFIGLIIGLLLAVIIKGIEILIHRSNKKISFPLVPYLAVGFIISYFWDIIPNMLENIL